MAKALASVSRLRQAALGGRFAFPAPYRGVYSALAMKLIRPSLIPKDMWQIIVEASADLEKRRAFQEQFEADVQKLQKPLYEARRVLQEIDVVLERIKRLR